MQNAHDTAPSSLVLHLVAELRLNVAVISVSAAPVRCGSRGAAERRNSSQADTAPDSRYLHRAGQ